jgi:hypothetical protein
MECVRPDVLREELFKLLDKQIEALRSQIFGAANVKEQVEYEYRRESIRRICESLIAPAHS